jgi:DNA-binding NarL/FixJ family response regulator
MKILLIEDMPRKAESIKAVLSSQFPKIELSEESSYHAAIENIANYGNEYDVILLDMSMNTFNVSVEENGGIPEPFAGVRILEKLFLNEIDTRVIVISMYHKIEGKDFKEIGDELMEQYPNLYEGFVLFAFDRNDWKLKLINLISSYYD